MPTLDEILERCAQATPGPYHAGFPSYMVGDLKGKSRKVAHFTISEGARLDNPNARADSRYFEALTPEVVAALVKVVQEMEKPHRRGCGHAEAFDCPSCQALDWLHLKLEGR